MAAPTEDELRTAMMTFGNLAHEYRKWQKERVKLREALTFYADFTNYAWRRLVDNDGKTVRRDDPLVNEDLGRRAQEALKPFDPFAPPPAENDSRVG
jgi:hypothetical protein